MPAACIVVDCGPGLPIGREQQMRGKPLLLVIAVAIATVGLLILLRRFAERFPWAALGS